MRLAVGSTEEFVRSESLERTLASMTSLCESVATELEAFQDECQIDPVLNAKAQALVARIVVRIVAVLDTIRAEFPAEARH